MSPRLPDDKRLSAKEPDTSKRSFSTGLWMDEMVDKMLEQSPSGYVGFHTTYKEDIRKLSTKS